VYVEWLRASMGTPDADYYLLVSCKQKCNLACKVGTIFVPYV
jgi:hypothetical protein